jgi:hypothetical protein
MPTVTEFDPEVAALSSPNFSPSRTNHRGVETLSSSKAIIQGLS